MSWSPEMRSARRARGGQADMFDGPILAYKLVCDGDRSLLDNRMTRARKAHVCNICGGPIHKGERVRDETRRSEDGRSLVHRRVCPRCVPAIVAWCEGDATAINARHDLARAAQAGAA